MPESRHQSEQATALAPSIPVNVQDRHTDNGKGHLHVPGALVKPHSGGQHFCLPGHKVRNHLQSSNEIVCTEHRPLANIAPAQSPSLGGSLCYITGPLSFVLPISALPLGATYTLPASPLSLVTRLLDPKVKKETSRLFNLHPHSKAVTLLACLH